MLQLPPSSRTVERPELTRRSKKALELPQIYMVDRIAKIMKTFQLQSS